MSAYWVLGMKVARRRFVPCIYAAVAASAFLPAGTTVLADDQAAAEAGAADPALCTKTSQGVLKACGFEALSDFWISNGNCDNLPVFPDRQACRQTAEQDLGDARAECSDQFQARQDVCAALGEAPYDPVINPANFVRRITNPLLPMIPGTTFVYRGGGEVDTVRVTHDTKEILGVIVTVVRDTVTVNGQVTEDTEDWFAQDRAGNVWYFGEISQTFENGELVSLEGSWKAGVDGAKPGIIMEARPRVHDTYRQEFALGTAEDMAEVLSLTGTARVPAAACNGNCLVTREFSPLEPDVNEHKFYAPGVGLILEVDMTTGERLRLVSVTH